MSTLPAGFAKLILSLAYLFSKRVFQSAQVLLAGAILATGKPGLTCLSMSRFVRRCNVRD